MHVQSQQGPRIDGQTSYEHERRKAQAVEFLNAGRAVLMAQNRDNVVFETGTMAARE
jgi:hypothetical protein